MPSLQDRVPPRGDAPIDWAHLDHATLGDAALAREVLGLFLEQLAGFDAEIATPSDAVPAHVHRLKGAARAIGAWPVAEAAQAVERSFAAPGGTGEALTDLAGQVAAVRASIERHLGQVASGAGAAQVESL